MPRDTILHEILPRFNPHKLRDLQHVLTLREVYVDTDGGRVRLISDDDLKECYFEKAWGFRKDEWGRDEFVLANWREMSVEEMKEKVRGAQPLFYHYVYPPGKVNVYTLETKDEIVRMFWELTYVPREVYGTAVGGAHVLRSVKAGDVGEKHPEVVGEYLNWACRAGLDLPVIRGLAEKCRERDLDAAAERAARGGHTDVLDLLASEFGAEIGVDCLTGAARRGHNAMIDHLVEQYGVDPNGDDGDGWTALHKAARRGLVRTVKHLVEKHKVDIHKKTMRSRQTALDDALRSDMTACAAYLREVTYTQLLTGEYRGDVDVWLFLSAARRGDDAMIDLLVERYGVDPNGDEDGWTALHSAAQRGRVRTVKHLVEKHNVDIHKRTGDGETALDRAQRWTECVSYLLEVGAKNGWDTDSDELESSSDDEDSDELESSSDDEA